ncbi:Chorismate mutase AroH [Bhargavaea cecembensis DSE10]|uniref:chorismate mutase n=2 Tax=Bhargavaea cecembensis TaxID=394098 RepID=M7NFS5_9BACL|nr:Chorismate mutase AroH [Bhargavaea cecembensis DSE10]
MMVRGIRGATCITADEDQQIMQETAALAREMAEQNGLEPEEIVSVIISTTTDITSGFPAKAVRTMDGWEYVPVMCTHEMDVPGALPLCIRLLMHANTTKTQKEIKHIYRNEAVRLRPDLAGAAAEKEEAR